MQGDEDILNSIEASPLVSTNYADTTTSSSNANALLIAALGLPSDGGGVGTRGSTGKGGGTAATVTPIQEEPITESSYDIMPNPNIDQIDLSDLRGVGEMKKKKKHNNDDDMNDDDEDDDDEEIDGIPAANMSDTDLENLAELVPDIKTRAAAVAHQQQHHHPSLFTNSNTSSNQHHHQSSKQHPHPSAKVILNETDTHEPQVELVNSLSLLPGNNSSSNDYYSNTRSTPHVTSATAATPQSMKTVASTKPNINNNQTMDSSLHVGLHESLDFSRNNKRNGELDFSTSYKNRVVSPHISLNDNSVSHDNDDDDDDYPDSEHALEDTMTPGQTNATGTGANHTDSKLSNEYMNIGSSANSISTATQTHEVRMPMYLKTFKPATGCTNASDFIVRCFVARLRSGITVVKHGRSRWCKSRLRVLHIHPDGRSLSWKPAEGEPASSRRPPKLDLSTCLEVRHAWSPDPQNPMYTGTPILRQKCEAANAHKSFALIFKQRTVDITAVTADQCKVLMEGFSALCFRLQVANLAGRNNTDNSNNKKGANNNNNQHARPMPEEDGVSTTASATLTNTSIPKVR